MPNKMPTSGNILFKKSDCLLFGLFYAIIFIAAYFPFGAAYFAAVLLSIIFVHVILNRDIALIYPAAIFPLMFVIRTPDPDYILLIILPDVLVILAIAICFPRILMTKYSYNRDQLMLLAVFLSYMMLSMFIMYCHIIGKGYLLILVRTYFLPLLFTLVFVRVSLMNDLLPQMALRIFVVSMVFVACVSLLQYLNIIHINSRARFLESVMIYGGSGGKLEYIARRDSPLFGSIERINLLTGGSIGSSGAVFLLVSILCFWGHIFRASRMVKYWMGAVCFLVALLSASFSILIPISIFFCLITLHKVNKSSLTIVLWLVFLLPAILVVWAGYTFDGRTAITYAHAIPDGLKYMIDNQDIVDFLFGIGPAFLAKGYMYLPKNYIFDIGILRMYQECGIFAFGLILIFLAAVAYIALKKAYKQPNISTIQFALPFLVLCLLVHQNYLVGPPFYILFATSVAGIITGMSGNNHADVEVCSSRYPISLGTKNKYKIVSQIRCGHAK